MRKHSVIALLLLVASCGAAGAVSSDVSTDVSIDDQPSIPKPTINDFGDTVPPVGFPITSSKDLTDAEVAFPDRLALTTKDGKVVTFSPHEDPIVTPGVPSPNGDVVVSASFMHGRTMIEWHDLKTDIITGEVQVDGQLQPVAVAQDGELVALIGSTKTSTTVVLATPTAGEKRRWTFDSVLVPEAFANAYDPAGDGLPIGVFAIEYLSTESYRVRVIDTATGQLGLPLNLRDKSQVVDEVMTAVSRTAVFDPVNQLLFTLYQGAEAWGDDEAGSFVHTLGLVNGVWCLDVPDELALEDNAGALAISPDGQRLYAASGAGGVAAFVVNDLTTLTPEEPKARTTAALDSPAAFVAMGASNDEVVIALGSSIFRLDPITLAVRASFTLDMIVEALTVLDDGSIVIAGSGRMTMVSPQNEILAERVLPAVAANAVRLAVID